MPQRLQGSAPPQDCGDALTVWRPSDNHYNSMRERLACFVPRSGNSDHPAAALGAGNYACARNLSQRVGAQARH
jgi:hypothetical protein